MVSPGAVRLSLPTEPSPAFPPSDEAEATIFVETRRLVRLETVSKTRRRDRDHNPVFLAGD